MRARYIRSLPTAADSSSSLDFDGTIEDLRYGPDGRLAMLATAHAVKEVGATEAGAPVAGDLDANPPGAANRRSRAGALRLVSPPDLFVYEYDWRPDGEGFVGTASPGNGDDNWWTAKLYAFSEHGFERTGSLQPGEPARSSWQRRRSRATAVPSRSSPAS